MPYVDNGQKSNDIGHCRRCKFQWVLAPDTKGRRGKEDSTHTGRVCPFCGSNSVYYTQEDNR